MQNNEKYGVELEAITSQFEKKMKQLEKDTAKFGETAKKNMGFNVDLNSEDEINKKIKELKKQKSDLEKISEKVKVGSFVGNQFTSEIESINNQISELENKLTSLNNKVEESDDIKITYYDDDDFEEDSKKIEKIETQVKDLKDSADDIDIKINYYNDDIFEDLEEANTQIEETEKNLAMTDEQIAKLIEYSEEALRPWKKMNQETEKVEKSVKKVKSTTEGFKFEIPDFTENVVSYQYQIEELTKRINDLKASLQMAKEDSSLFKPEEVSEMIIDLEKANNQLTRLQSQQSRVQGSTKATNNEVKKMASSYTKVNSNAKSLNVISSVSVGIFSNLGKKISDGFKKATASIKRLTLSLVGVHSAYFVISKAISNYEQYDESLTNKMKSAWASLGAFLAPLVDFIGTLVMKAVGYLNVFITALTGTNLLAKANEQYKYNKALKDTAKSADKATKSLTAMDEITNIPEKDTSSTDTSDFFNPFENVLNQELDPKWVKTLTEWGEKVRQIWDEKVYPAIKKVFKFIKDHKDEIIDILKAIGLTLLLWKIDPKLAISLGAIYYAIEKIKDYLDNPTWNNFAKALMGIGIAIAVVGLAFFGWKVVLVGLAVFMVGLLYKFWDKIKEFGEKIAKFFEDKCGIIGGILADVIRGMIAEWDGLLKGVKQIVDGIVKIFKGDLKNGLKTAGKGILNILIGGLNHAIRLLNTFLSPVRAVIAGIGKLTGNSSWNLNVGKIPYIPSLDVGTNKVAQDGLAYIHEGEAVVPKKFNSQEFFNSGNEETNALLIELIQAVEESGDKVPIFNVNGREFAQATFGDFENEKNRLNKTTMKRRNA